MRVLKVEYFALYELELARKVVAEMQLMVLASVVKFGLDPLGRQASPFRAANFSAKTKP